VFLEEQVTYVFPILPMLYYIRSTTSRSCSFEVVQLLINKHVPISR